MTVKETKAPEAAEREKKKKRRGKKNPFLFLAPLLLFAAGAGIFLYPAVSNYLAEAGQRNVIRRYEAAVEGEDAQKLAQAWEEAEIYNENLAGDPVHDPFIVGSGYVLPDNYGEVLNIGEDGVMGYVEIPKVDIYLPIYHGTDEETLQNGAGHLEVTALPIGGKNRHPVISAHRGLPSAELFTRLDEMETGDLFFLHILDRTLAYQVDRISVILPEELSLLTPEEDKDLVTLLTCTPYAVNTHRLLVRGSRIPWEAGKEAEETADAEGAEGAEREESENAGGWQAEYLRAAAAGLLLLLLLAAAVRAVRRRRKKRGK